MANLLSVGWAAAAAFLRLLEPLVLRPGQDLVDHLADRLGLGRLARFLGLMGDLAGLRDELLVEPFGHFEHAVPVGIVGGHHRGPVPRPATFVMPEIEPGPFDLFVELRRLGRDQLLLVAGRS